MKNCWKLKLNKKFTALLFVIQPFFAFSQFTKPEIDYPEDEKYIYPVNPGLPGSLAGTMGELRATHFHSGIDIRTNNQIGFPVLASKSGYISRVSVSPSGYGNIIYITHPDGNTTLYAHLHKFKGAIAEYVLQEQYNRKTFSIDLTLPEDMFPVRQGETIALSGNSGSSSGPHVHFDIRDRNNYALDPLKVAAFPEVPDKLPPAAEKIALKTLDAGSRINDQFGRFEFHALARSSSNYSIASPILAHGTIGIELIAKDRLAPNSPFYGGVNYIEVLVDSQLVFNQSIEKVNIAETRAIYTLMDFKTMRNKGTRFYKLYIDDGNNLDFYNSSPGSGKIKVNPDRESLVVITLRDSYDNKSTLSFKIRPAPRIRDVASLETLKSDVVTDVHENTLMISTKTCTDSAVSVSMFTRGIQVPLEADYLNKNRSVYLIDLRKNLPDSIVTCSKTVVTNLRDVVPPGIEYKYYGDQMDILFPPNALFDTLYLSTSYYKIPDGKEIFSIGDRLTPLNRNITVSIKPTENTTPKNSLAVYREVGKGYAYVGGKWDNGKVTFTTREFGDFTLLEDLVPPTIRLLNIDRSGARFKISDNLSGIDRIEANINGQWVLMQYDTKTATIWSEKLNKNVPLVGTFTLEVTDNAGNLSTFTRKIQ
jgi:hypothetical protein